jgi:phage anti-repressor protein/DNA-binding protein H-NS
MSNTQLIPVFTGTIAGVPAQLVDARLLHSFLKVGKDFSNWLKDRIRQYGFQENQDYICIAKSGDGENRGFQPIDYHLSLDMAKELSMVERNEKGKQARRYFIECERLAIEAFHPKLLPLPTYPTPEQRESIVNVLGQLSSITAELTKVVMKVEPEPKLEPEPMLSMPDYFPLLVFSKGTLEHLAEKVGNAIKIKKAEERKKLIAKIDDLAKNANVGVEFYDLESRKKEVPVQYRNPDNPSQTWRGRGIMPRWLQDKIASGHQKNDFKEPIEERKSV